VRTLFVDTLYWVALTNPKDQWNQRGLEIESGLGTVQLVTTDLVLVEVLNYFCTYGLQMRQTVVAVVHAIRDDSMVEVVPLTQELFTAGLQLYEARPDKGYSLTDCISMIVMHERNLTEVLTHDRHFSQEGFKILL
jgi:uncharacterized protein